MPLYEFRCRKCASEFEQIVFLTDQEPIKCPQCGGSNPERLLSIFSSRNAATDTGTSPASSSCGVSSRGFS
ncbi:MAG: zinc ribbon domain-containing protein [Desulfobacterales bacterium]|nr:zinc ribbon domain-containing protein [Desulfobacterales bacterium]